MYWEFKAEKLVTRKEYDLQKAHEVIKRVLEDCQINSMWCIAGGAVRDFQHSINRAYPTISIDYDVFLASPISNDKLNKLAFYGILSQTDSSYSGCIIHTLKHRDLESPIQFIYVYEEPSEATTLEEFVEDTLSKFDWDINCVAYRNEFLYSLTPVYKQLDVLYLKSPGNNPVQRIKRGIEFANRYGKVIDSEAWVMLAQAILNLEHSLKLDDVPF